VAVGSGIILDNFTASRGDREEREPVGGLQVELAIAAIAEAYLF